MTRAYVNYPNAKVRLHGKAGCGHVQQARKTGQRLVTVDLGSLSAELARFAQRQHAFGSSSVNNDMWIEVNVGDAEFERAVVAFIHRSLANRYQRLAAAVEEIHC